MCEHFDHFISGYNADGPPSGESRRFELHLELCRQCRSKAGLARGSATLKSQPADDLAFNLFRQSLAVVDEAPAKKGLIRVVTPRQWWLHNA